MRVRVFFVLVALAVCSSLLVCAASVRSASAGSLDPAAIVADLTKQGVAAAGAVAMPPEIQKEIQKATAATTAALAATQTKEAAPAPAAPVAAPTAGAAGAAAPAAAPAAPAVVAPKPVAKPVNDEEEGSTPPPGWTPPKPLQSLKAAIKKSVAVPPPTMAAKIAAPSVAGFAFEKGMNVMWGVNKDGQAVSRINGAHPQARWVAHKKRTDLASIVASPNRKSRAVFALTTQGEVLQRANVTRQSPLGKGWTKLVGSLTSLAVTGADALWGVTAASLVFYKSSSASATDASWTKVAVPADLQLKQISAAGYKHVVGLTKDGAVVVRTGIKRGKREGESWAKAPATVGATSAPKFDSIAVGPKGQLWGLDAAGSLFYASNSTAEWAVVKDLPAAGTKFSSLSVANDGQLVAVSVAGPLYARRGIPKSKRTGMGSSWAKVPRSTKARLTRVAAAASIRAQKPKSTMPKMGKALSKKQLRAQTSRTFSLRFSVPDSKFGRDSSKLRLRKALARIGGISTRRVSIVSIRAAANLPNQSEITFKFARVGAKSAAKMGAKGKKGKKGSKAGKKGSKGGKKGSKKHSKKGSKKNGKKSSKKHSSKKNGKGKKGGKKSGKKGSKGKKRSQKRKQRTAGKALAKVASRLRFRSVLTQVQKGILKSAVASSLTVIGKKGTRRVITPKPLKRRQVFRSPAGFKRRARVVFVQKRKAGANYTAPFVLSASATGGLVLAKRARQSADPSQLWRLSKEGQLSFKDAKGQKQCVESAPRPAGATKVKKLAVNISPCVVASPLQKFQWLSRGNRLRAVGSNMCLTVENRDKDGDRLPLEQARVILRKCGKKGGRKSRRQRFGFKQARRSRKRARALGFSVTIAGAVKSLPKDFAQSVSIELGKAANAPAARFNVTAVKEAAKSSTGAEQSTVTIAVLPSKDKAAANTTVLFDAITAALANSATAANNAFLSKVAYGSLAAAKLPRKQYQKFRADKASKIELYAAPGSVIEAAWGGKAGPQTELVIAEFNPMSPSQSFSLNRKSGALTFVDRFNVTRCVELRKSKDAAVAPRLISARCKRTGSRSQSFRYDSRVQALRHVASRQCLALPQSNTKPGTKLALQSCDVKSSDQMWDYPARYPSDIRVQLARAKAAEAKAEAEAKRVIAEAKRIELQQKEVAAKQARKEAAAVAKAKEVRRKARAARQAEVKLLALKKTVPKNSYALSVKNAIRKSSAVAGLPGSSSSLTCRDLSNIFGIAAGVSIGPETPSLYRQAWTAKKCATVPLSCQETVDCYDFEHMAANNAAAIASGFVPANSSELASAPFAPIMLVQNYRKCSGVRPLDCAGMSEFYGISVGFVGTAPKCVQKKFASLGCRTAPAQTCQVLSNRFGLGAPAKKAPTEAAATKALSARFMALAGLSRNTPAAANAVVIPSAAEATFIAPEKAASIFAERRCSTKPASCQAISTQFKCWPGHQGKASDDTFRQFNLRGCKTRPALTCAQLSDSFLFGHKNFHPKPEAHGLTADSLGADVFNIHAALSAETAPSSFMELSSTYSGSSLRNAPYKKIDGAYFTQWVKSKCTTTPHSCQEMSAIYGLSPNSRGAATAAIARTFTSKLQCSTHPALSCAELSSIYGITAESVHEASTFLQAQWAAQKCTTSIPSCQQLSDEYDLPRGEWSSYAPSGVVAQFNALGCTSEPLPSCPALSDFYLINHAQIDPSKAPDVGIASRLILAKYSRWGCHHAPRDCQQLSDFFQIGTDKAGKMSAGKNTPEYAKRIYRFRRCATSPIEGTKPGQVPKSFF